MPKASPIQNSFNAGELSPRLKGRSDLGKYQSGCEIMLNMIPQVHGPAKKRPGTRYVTETKDSTKKSRLIPFEFSTEQAYVLEFGHNYIRFYASGGVVLDSGSPYEISTPYASTELDAIDFAQSADVVYLAHPDHPPQKLSRYGATNWTLTEVDFDWPAFDSENLTADTMTCSVETGSGTVTASASTFLSTDVGAYIRFSEVIESKHNEFLTNESITTGDIRHYNGNLYKATTTGTTGKRPPIHVDPNVNESDGAVTWQYLHSGAGYVEITGYTSATVVSVNVKMRVPASCTSATKKWSRSAWSDDRGYPKAVTFYEDRLWFAGSLFKPQTLWASVTSDYENHEYGTEDDMALNYTINTQYMNTIEWLYPGKVLAIGTAGGEFTLSASNINEPVTPTNVRIVPQTSYGNINDIRPIRIGSAVLFVQRSATKLREYVYEFDSDSYVAPDMTLLAEHIGEAGFIGMAYQQEPSQIIWVVRKDGRLVGMTYERAEDVVGWHDHDISGVVESIVTIPHWDGDQDSTWMVVKRTINGSTVRYIEYLEKHINDEKAFYVDCGLTYDGSSTTSISGLTHLEGETVSVLVDGAAHPDATVSSGSITLQTAGSKVVVGLSYTARIKTMPLEAGAADGTSQGKTQRINNLVIRLDKTGPGLWYGPDSDNMDEYHQRTSNDEMDEPLDLLTGDTNLLPFPGDNETSAQIQVEHRLPLPFTLIALMPQVTTYDR